MLKTLVVIAIGASFGAILRWFLGQQLNQWFPAIPPGTLLANFLGGYIVGLALAYFTQLPSLSPEWRLLMMTGFCGGLTTFSAFSVELFTLVEQARWGIAALMVIFHVLGTLFATFLGVITVPAVQWLLR